MKGHLPFQKALPTVCVGRVFQLVEKRGYAASKDRCFTYIGKIPMLKNGISRFDGLQDRERLHSSMSRTWKTPKPSMGIFRPLCKVADGSRGDGVGLIITSSRPPTTTTTPSPPPVRTGRSSTKRLVYLAKYPQGIALGIFLSYSFAEKRYSALVAPFLPLRFRTDLPLLV